MAAHYFIQFLSAVPARRSGSMAAHSPPLRRIERTERESTKEIQRLKQEKPTLRKAHSLRRQKENKAENPIPRARGSLLRLPPVAHLLRFLLAIPILLHRWNGCFARSLGPQGYTIVRQ